jgi:hypothetical protein
LVKIKRIKNLGFYRCFIFVSDMDEKIFECLEINISVELKPEE